jgi:hypothetical protein
MQPSQQAYYLQTLGIVQYVPKDSLLAEGSLLAEDSVVVGSEAPAVAFNDRSIEDAEETVVDRKTIDVAARMNLNFDEPAVAKKTPSAASPVKPAVSAAPEPKVPAELIEVKFSLWQPNAEILVCSGVEGALADGDQMQLLTNILNAVGCGIHRLPQMDLVEWPPYPNADGDENEVREFLTTLLQARLKARPVKYILLLGDTAADWLLSPQQRSEQSGFGSLTLTPETTALLIPSLSNMIETPQLKASAWQALKSVSFAPAAS